MKGRRIVLDHLDNREAAALMVDGTLHDLLIDGDAPRPGTVYRAVADRPVKGQGGMFLKTPDGAAFLRQVRGLSPGRPLLAQVSGYAESGKAIPVTQKLLFKSRYAIITPGAPGLNISRAIRDESLRDHLLELAHDIMGEATDGLILRSCAAHADAFDIEEDIQAMKALARKVLDDDSRDMVKLVEGDGPHVLAWRDWAAPADVVMQDGSFGAEGVLAALDALRGSRVGLEGGAHIFVEPTRALVAVDVNTGSDVSIAAGLKANLACARALPRLLRIKGLGGQIVLDLAPMPKKDRRSFETALRQAFKSDEIETALVGWTPLGHYELNRKRARRALHEVF